MHQPHVQFINRKKNTRTLLGALMRLSKNILRKKMWNLKQQYGQHQYKVFETLHFRKIKFRMCVCFGMEGMGARVSLLLVQPQIGHKRWSYRSRFLPSLDDNSDKQRKKEKSFCENTGIIVFYFPYFCHHHFSSRARFLPSPIAFFLSFGRFSSSKLIFLHIECKMLILNTFLINKKRARAEKPLV